MLTISELGTPTWLANAPSSTPTSTGSAAPAPTSASAVAASPAAGGTAIPPLSQITSGMPTGPTQAVSSTYAPGATPPVSGAPALPSTFIFNAADWPAQDVPPPTDSAEVAQWMTELDGFDIPDLDPTVDGTCASSPAEALDAANRGWWSCGGYTRATDIVACPDKMTWGVSFDDGPALYTQKLLNFLGDKDLHATFFVVGSRVIQYPQVLLEEYMSGHEISVHTWSHRPLTSQTTAEIVAELGWTRKAIQAVLGVTPTTMRPPYGDIDDRVRAIALAMGLVPIIWSRSPSGLTFDTNDWKVAGGLVNGTQSFGTFESILGNATMMDTGFIVLEHDLYEITVDLATGYTLNAALNHNPPFNLEPIGQCVGIPTSNLYRESNTNTSFPYTNNTSGTNSSVTGTGTSGSANPNNNNNNAAGSKSSGAVVDFTVPGLRSVLAAALLMLGGYFL
ncbi:carbohydrate esterase family 4 protein [Jaapia argillacea MUCL 33604]|uniref:chitin deacetylase n=1 Tax=Jaapia argillacea MUCL 33604 TaxID=933084 RepID=A0A067QFM1_9AGAM|nr:carbohydrate esterase family 4 protein [Jaapia argillacea MUCL 33604]